MINYNYHNLSDVDFESLSKDLLERKLKIELERFTSGRDKGIDLRYSKGDCEDIIVQCKHYKDTKSLIRILKKEVDKVSLLAPKRYIIATSASLTKHNKEEIKKLFNPYIKSTADILGKQDIDDLLKVYRDVEINHYKLWLSSSRVLERIINSKVYNEADFLLESIEEKINIYVQNESFKEALQILSDKKYVVISGIPGIGKSTLAYMISYYLLGKNYNEFIFMSDSVDVGLQHYSKGKKQIFLFDDFLGKSLLENKLNTNEEQKIIDFIKLITKSTDKILIITTREYVLNQAREKFESFSHFNWKESKCIVDLTKYSKLIRAKILYNHLYFSDVPKLYIENLLDNRNYLKIINHRNYSPRVIQLVVLEGKWKEIGSGEFYVALNNYLNNPNLVWDHAFRINITEISRITLLLLLSLGEPVFIEDLYHAVNAHCKSIKFIESFNESEYKKTLKELEGTFIVLSKDAKNRTVVQFQNPSIQDFLLNFLKENVSYRKDIISGAHFFNQLFTLFCFESETKGKLLLEESELKTLNKKLVLDYERMDRSSLIKVVEKKDENSYWIKRTESDFYKISTILNNIKIASDQDLKNLIDNKILNLDFTSITGENLTHLSTLVYKTEVKPRNIKKFFKDAPVHLNWVSNLEDYYEVAAVYNEEFQESIGKEDLDLLISQIVQEEMSSTQPDECAALLEKVESLKDNFGCSLDEEVEELKDLIHTFESEEQARWADMDIDELPGVVSEAYNEDDIIIDMFESLK